jgi:hypothetical protein
VTVAISDLKVAPCASGEVRPSHAEVSACRAHAPPAGGRHARHQHV